VLAERHCLKATESAKPGKVVDAGPHCVAEHHAVGERLGAPLTEGPLAGAAARSSLWVMAGPDMIRTPDQRVRVFVSSALGELAAERRAVRDAVTQLRLVPVMFELGARPHPPRPVYRSYLAQSQVFVGIYWQSYGWVAPGEQISGAGR
jgi:Domain of unknown function (DUF4062)